MRPNKEPKRAQYLYEIDIQLIKEFMSKKGISTFADGVRVAIEYANAHGALS